MSNYFAIMTYKSKIILEATVTALNLTDAKFEAERHFKIKCKYQPRLEGFEKYSVEVVKL